jgi:diacylglycerol kinase family enzyme
MRVSLLYHEGAGEGISAGSLREAIEQSGHVVEHMVKETPHLERVLEGTTELLVAAGGDGTVRRAVQALAGSDIPLAILPMGTANNVAKSLGFDAPLQQLIEAWHESARRPFDIGFVEGAGSEWRFLEGAGSGLVPSAIAAVKSHADDKADESASRLIRAVQRYRTVLSRLEPQRWKVTVDDQSLEGEFLLLEILNTPAIGPNLVLSEEVNPSDGFLSVVAVAQDDRDKLAEYLQCKIEQRECGIAFPARHGRRIVIDGWNEMHIDGEVHRWAEDGPVTIEVEAAAVEYLAPRPDLG